MGNMSNPGNFRNTGIVSNVGYTSNIGDIRTDSLVAFFLPIFGA